VSIRDLWGTTTSRSPWQILAYALVFGYAHQLLTGLIDREARGLLSAVPRKDAEQGRPQPAVALSAPRRATT
jgi:hypothetical protein